MDASTSCWSQHDGGLASEVEQGRRCTTGPRLGRRCYGGSPSPLENTLGGKGDRVAQAASEQQTGPTVTCPCPKRTTLTARRPALMARPASRSAGSSTDPPAPCHAKPSSGGSRDTPSVDSSLLQPSYTPEGGLAFVTNCRPRHQTRDHHPINYLTSSTQTPPSLHQADVTSSSHAQRTGGVHVFTFHA